MANERFPTACVQPVTKGSCHPGASRATHTRFPKSGSPDSRTRVAQPPEVKLDRQAACNAITCRNATSWACGPSVQEPRLPFTQPLPAVPIADGSSLGESGLFCNRLVASQHRPFCEPIEQYDRTYSAKMVGATLAGVLVFSLSPSFPLFPSRLVLTPSPAWPARSRPPQPRDFRRAGRR